MAIFFFPRFFLKLCYLAKKKKKKKKKPFQMSKYKLTLVISHYCQQWLKSSKLVVNSSNIYWFSTDATSNYWLYKSILNFLLSPKPWPSVIYYQITYLYFRSVPQAEKKREKSRNKESVTVRQREHPSSGWGRWNSQ